MGMCRECKKVFYYRDIKDHYCKNCRPDLFSEEELQRIQQREDKINQKDEPIEEVEQAPKAFKWVWIILILVIVGGGYWIYNENNKPSDSIVELIAAQYASKMDLGDGYGATPTITILKSFEKNGETVEVLQINNAICKMPMLKNAQGEWISTGIYCGGGNTNSY
jgi:hypothetical protein